jgi:hypothetical protein
VPKVKVDCQQILSKASGSSANLHLAYLKKAKRSEGKILALSARMALEESKIDNNRYFNLDELKSEINKENNGTIFKRYTIGDSDSDPQIKCRCPNCRITTNSYKIAIYGNLDEDDDFDILVISNEDKMAKELFED